MIAPLRYLYILSISLWSIQCGLAATSSLPDAVVPLTTTLHGKVQLPETLTRSSSSSSSKEGGEEKNVLPSVLITLNHGEYSTYSTYRDGEFTFANIPLGVHVLDVQTPHYIFSQVKIQLKRDEEDPTVVEEPKYIEYVYPGAPKQPLLTAGTNGVITMTAHGTYQYFEPRPTISVFALLKNPMVLMMVVGAVLMVSMPYMMEGLDDEQKEQMKKQMEVQQDPSKMINSFFGNNTDTAANDAAKKLKKLKDKGPRKRRE